MRFFTSVSVRSKVTIAVWLLGMLLATTLIARRPSAQIRGLGFAEPLLLTAPTDGTLAEFEIGLHQSVAVGELVAHFDQETLTARHHVLQAEIESLTRAQVMERQGRTRLFERDREAADIELGELSARIQESQAEMEALHERLEIQQRLFAEGVVAREQALAVEREIRVGETRLAADRERLGMVRLSASRASNRAATAPAANEWQVEAARRQLEEIEKLIGQLSLRSSIAGQVTDIYRHPGEWLQAGEPILRVTPLVTTEVHAWVGARATPSHQPGGTAQIRRSNGQRLTGTVKSVGVERLEMPAALWARANAPEWGYRVRVELTDGVLSPGESVQVGLGGGR